MESPLKLKPGCVIAIQKRGSIHSSQVHSNKAAGKNGPRGVSFLKLDHACAYVAVAAVSGPLQGKQLAPREVGNFTRFAGLTD